MAGILWREPNQVKWVGFRPAHRGTKIVKVGSVANGTLLVYTVSAGKTLHLAGSVAGALSPGGAGAKGFAYIQDDADVLWFSLGNQTYTDGEGGAAVAFCPAFPLEVPAGYDFVIYGRGAGLTMSLSIFGWEE